MADCVQFSCGRSLVVVTPVLNGAAFIDETISNVVAQRGNFRLRYHVQDGGSSDETLEILQSWEARLGSARQGGREGVDFSWDSRTDRGMYDAITNAYEHVYGDSSVCDADASIMTWINAGDLFATSAFRTALEFFDRHQEFDWLTGMAAILTESGASAQVYGDPEAFSQVALARGYHDGRQLPFVPQEGSFWRRSLWARSGGLDRSLRYAGDWDLWRRFAMWAPLARMQNVLGYHRLHRGQLSEDGARYYAEVDSMQGNEAGMSELRDFGFKIVYDANLNRWHAQQID